MGDAGAGETELLARNLLPKEPIDVWWRHHGAADGVPEFWKSCVPPRSGSQSIWIITGGMLETAISNAFPNHVRRCGRRPKKGSWSSLFKRLGKPAGQDPNTQSGDGTQGIQSDITPIEVPLGDVPLYPLLKKTNRECHQGRGEKSSAYRQVPPAKHRISSVQ